MNRHAWIAALLLALTAGVWGFAGEPCCPSDQSCFLQRISPVGGWCPYVGGLLHWWNPHCFPRCGGPDDYCRKDLPAVCWPPYPPWYVWGPGAGHDAHPAALPPPPPGAAPR
jgi:hypothetical protein